MNKENMLKWADVLESGKYKQFQGGWGGCNYGGHCCLNAALVEFTGTEYEDMPDTAIAIAELNKFFGFYDMPAENFFTPEQLASIGAADAVREDMHNHFMVCNDELKLSFPEIATKIRSLVNASA